MCVKIHVWIYSGTLDSNLTPRDWFLMSLFPYLELLSPKVTNHPQSVCSILVYTKSSFRISNSFSCKEKIYQLKYNICVQFLLSLVYTVSKGVGAPWGAVMCEWGLRLPCHCGGKSLRRIKTETCFSHNQIIYLYSQFTSLDKSENGTLSWEDFQWIPGLVIKPLGDWLISGFFPDGKDQAGFHGFIKSLVHFWPTEDSAKCKDKNGPEPLNSRSNKLYFAFRLYDLDKNDKIFHNELFQVLCMMAGVNVSDEQLGGITDRTIQEADLERDGAISFEEFVEALEKVNWQAESEHPISWLKGQDQTVPCSLVSKNWTWESSCLPALPLPYYLSKILRQPPFGVHGAFQNSTPSSFLFSIHSPVPPL